MTQSLRFQVDGVELMAKEFDRVMGGINNLRQFFPLVVQEFEKIQREWFQSQGRGNWQPLSPSYALWKGMHFPGLPLLVLSGDLRDSAFRSAIGQNTLVIDTSPPQYWAFHQFGTIKMPARPPYINDAQVGNELGEVLRKAIINYLSKI